MLCFPYVKYLVSECSQLQNIKCLRFRKSAVNFTIRKVRVIIHCFFCLFWKDKEKTKYKNSMVVNSSHSSCQKQSWSCGTEFLNAFSVPVKMLVGLSVRTNYIKFPEDVMGIREKTNVFSTQNYPTSFSLSHHSLKASVGFSHDKIRCFYSD